jgi:hypothetical protein
MLGEADGARSESPELSRRLPLAGGRGTGRIAGEADGPRSVFSGVSECDIREVGVGRSPAERLFSGGRGTECIAPECDSRTSGAAPAVGGLGTPPVAIAAPLIFGLSSLTSLNGGRGTFRPDAGAATAVVFSNLGAASGRSALSSSATSSFCMRAGEAGGAIFETTGRAKVFSGGVAAGLPPFAPNMLARVAGISIFDPSRSLANVLASFTESGTASLATGNEFTIACCGTAVTAPGALRLANRGISRRGPPPLL